VAGKRRLEEAAAVASLAKRLARSPQVAAFDERDNPESWGLAHALSDLEDCPKVVEAYIPRLTEQELQPSELEELLLDIGEELRHILSHIENSRFYGYLLPPRVKV
jgi:hypothetical protein